VAGGIDDVVILAEVNVIFDVRLQAENVPIECVVSTDE
jgi:hypothetical protein